MRRAEEVGEHDLAGLLSINQTWSRQHGTRKTHSVDVVEPLSYILTTIALQTRALAVSGAVMSVV
jgi:hypothetical protein